MKLTRDAIVGGDFAQAVDGWNRGDVLRHLNAIAEALEALQDRSAPAQREDSSGAQEEAQALVQAARAEANSIRAQASEDAEREIARAQLAVKDLLDRVGSLNLGVEEARRAVEGRGSEMARRLEESAEPFVTAMRERAEALGAEVELMATGLAVSARASEPEPEPEPAAPEPAAPEPPPEPEPEPEPEPGIELSAGEVDEAVQELATDAPEPPAPAGRERARLVALNMALGGASEEEAERRLREDLDIEDPGEILDDAYGRARGGR